MSEVVNPSSRMPNRIRARDILVLILIWCWMSAAFLGMRPWSSRGEPREALVAQSMFETGNMVLGEGYGGIVPSKPPVLHWSAVAISQLGSEVSEWSMRAPSAFAALAMLLLVFGIARRVCPSTSPLLAALLLATSLEFFRSGIEARVDMVLCAAMFGALIAMYRFLVSGSFLLAASSAALLAIAVLAKGPVGFLLPCAAVTLFWWIERRSFWRPFLLLLPAGTAVGIAGIWYWEALQIGGQAFFERVKYENVLRFLGTQDDQPHKHSALYLFGMLLVGMLPWTFLLLPKFLIHPKAWLAQISLWYRRLPEEGRLLAVWCIVVFVFFCIPSSKRGVYLLPMYPALAVLLASVIERVRAPIVYRTAGAIFILAGMFGLGLELGLLRALDIGARAGEAVKALSDIAASSPTIWLAHAAFLLAGVALVVRARVLPVLLAAGLLAIGFGAAHGGILPLGARWLSAQPFAAQLASELSPSTRVLSFGHEFYGLSFYLKRRISRLEENPAQPGDVVIVHQDRRAELEKLSANSQRFRYEFVARSLGPIDEPFNPAFALRVQPEPGVDNGAVQ